jgi:hypothetical protein
MVGKNRNKKIRAISSVGSEHLVYTEGVGGSNPSSPTDETNPANFFRGVFYGEKIMELVSVRVA